MALAYGLVKCNVVGPCRLKSSRHKNELQYHLHAQLQVMIDGQEQSWDVAVNVGTDDSDDLLRYRLVYDFHHPMIADLDKLPMGRLKITEPQFPALDFLRSNLLKETGSWRDSDIMDGEVDREPYRSLARLLEKARSQSMPVYIFGRFYNTDDGIHDVHMNQGSRGGFMNQGDDHNDHNDVWQDGAVMVATGEGKWAAYFTAFTQQAVPTDDMGNPKDGAHEMDDGDPGMLS
jgi:uncharacterized protein YukJ